MRPCDFVCSKDASVEVADYDETHVIYACSEHAHDARQFVRQRSIEWRQRLLTPADGDDAEDERYLVT